MTPGKVYGTSKLKKMPGILLDFLSLKMHQFEKKNPPKFENY